MFKKLIVLMMTLSIFSAQAATQSGLKEVFDELNYSLSVEWDQKDLSYKQLQMDKFSDALSELKEQGLTDAEIVQFLKSEIQNQKIAQDMEQTLHLMTMNKMSPQEAQAFLVDSVNKTYGHGANWTAEDTFDVVMGTILVAFVTWMIIGFATHPKDANPIKVNY